MTSISDLGDHKSFPSSDEEDCKVDEELLSDPEKLGKSIQDYLCKNRDHLGSATIEFYDSVLKRYQWAYLEKEPLDDSIKEELSLLTVGKIGKAFQELIAWTRNLPLQFLNKKFTEKAQNSPDCKMVNQFLADTEAVLSCKMDSYSDEEIRQYAHILSKYVCEKKLPETILPLLTYLSRTEYRQFSLILKEIEDTAYSVIFVKALVTRLILDPPLKLNQLYSDKRLSADSHSPLENVCLAIQDLMLKDSCLWNPLFIDILCKLLEDESYSKMLEEVFTKLERELVVSRFDGFFTKIINDPKKEVYQIQILSHFMRIVLKNRQFVTRLNEKRLESFSREDLLRVLLKVYGWSDFSEEIIKRLKGFVFNPLLYRYMESFRKITEGLAQTYVCEIILNLIEHSDSDLVSETEKCEAGFTSVSELMKIFLGRFHCNIYGGAGYCFSFLVLSSLKGVSAIKGPTHKKIEIVRKVLNTCLKLQLEHVGLLENKGEMEKLSSIIESMCLNVNSLEDIEERVRKFEILFFHQLFALLYSDDDFKKWFREENPGLNKEDLERVLKVMSRTREDLKSKYGGILKSKGFEFVHNNQIGSLAIVSTLIEEKNIFLQLGTGQGKSLIAEMAAISMLDRKGSKPERVFIFTSYDHLAKRDFESMKFLSEVSGHKSVYISHKTDFFKDKEEIKKAKIFHLDSGSFHWFLTYTIQSALVDKKDLSDLVNIFFNQDKNAVVLDEGDLMILDDPKQQNVVDCSGLFDRQSIDIRTPQGTESFENMVGQDFIKDLNKQFPSSYSSWYERVKSGIRSENGVVITKSTPEMDEKSGKIVHFSPGFGAMLSIGVYQLSSVLFSFSSYARSFGEVLFLSGSINKENVESFDKYFKNKKPTFYATIPLFFGSHNREYKLDRRKDLGSLEEEKWNRHILEDIREASFEKNQPVLVFAEPGQDLENPFKDRKNSFSEDLGKRVQIITTENNLDERAENIGKRGVVTLATIICGRGLDIRVSEEIKEGLHVLITHLPDGYNGRLLVQMEGRTARLNRNGSVSILVKEDLNLFREMAEANKKKSVVDASLDKTDNQLDILKFFLEEVKYPIDKEIGKRWVVFLDVILKNEGYLKKISEVKDFIGKHILKN